MGESEERREGNYASPDLFSPGIVPLQNDLGLTLLPGSQIENGDESLSDAAFGSIHLQYSELCGRTDTSMVNVDLDCPKDDGSLIARSDSIPQSPAPGKSLDLWIDDIRDPIAGYGPRYSVTHQSLPGQQGLAKWSGNGSLRYSQKILGLKSEKQETGCCKEKKICIPLAETFDHEPSSADLSSPRDQTSTQPGKDHVAESSRSTEKKALSTFSQYSGLRFLRKSRSALASHRAYVATSIYPRLSKLRSSPVKVVHVHPPALPQSSHPNISRSSIGRGLSDVTSKQALRMLQAELKCIKKDLSAKTRAESDARYTIHEIRKAYNDLVDDTNAHSTLQRVHNSLISEHRRLLLLYDNLAKAHASCRPSSTKKLAQRLVDAAPTTNWAAYPSPSPSIVAHCVVNNAHISHNTDISPTITLVDLTRSPSPTPFFELPCAVPTHTTEHDQHHTTDNDSRYENMNGFDDEANEMFNSLWESEMADRDTENNEAVEQP